VVEGNAKVLFALVEEVADLREEVRAVLSLLSLRSPDPLPTPSKDENAA
jgi:hypothetical protein